MCGVTRGAASLLLLAAAGACDGGATSGTVTPPAGTKVGAAPVESASAPTAAPRLRDFAPTDPTHVDLAFLVHGQAEAGWFTRGGGTLAIEIEQDAATDGGATAHVTTTLSAAPRTPATVVLPGRGSRALRVRAVAPAGATIESVRIKDEPLPKPEAGALAGALRGRSLAIVACDALHATHLGCYGSSNATSPKLDQLATQGVRFAAMRSQTSWTVPSIATLFTGRTQEQHGVRDVGQILDGELPTLAETFRAAGYATAAFLQNKLITQETGLARGFDEWQEFPGESRTLLLPALERFLAQPRAQPLFLYVHLLPPHAPYQPPPEFAGRFGAPKGSADGSVAFLAELAHRQPKANDSELATMRSLYDNHVAYGDALAGTVAELFFARGREQSALLFLSDHGEAFGQHEAVGHNTQVFDEMVHVPLLLIAPGAPLPAGSVVSAPVWMPDLAPSLRELFDLELEFDNEDDGSLDEAGRSFAGLLGATAAGVLPRPLTLSSRFIGNEQPQRAVVYGSMKLVSPAGRRITALYDVAADPGETTDVSALRPILAAALRDELARFAATALARKTASRFTPDAKLRAELEALGYTGDH